MKKILAVLCLIGLLSSPVLSGDLEELKIKREAVVKQIQQHQTMISQLQVALIQLDAVIAYITEKAEKEEKGEKK